MDIGVQTEDLLTGTYIRGLSNEEREIGDKIKVLCKPTECQYDLTLKSGNTFITSAYALPENEISWINIRNLEHLSIVLLDCVDLLLYDKCNHCPKALSDCIMTYIAEPSELWVQQRVVFIHSMIKSCLTAQNEYCHYYKDKRKYKIKMGNNNKETFDEKFKNSKNFKKLSKDRKYEGAIMEIAFEIVLFVGGYGLNPYVTRVLSDNLHQIGPNNHNNSNANNNNRANNKRYNCYETMTSHSGRVAYGTDQDMIETYITDGPITSTNIMNKNKTSSGRVYYCEFAICHKSGAMWIGIVKQSLEMNEFLSNINNNDNNSNISDIYENEQNLIDLTQCNDMKKLHLLSKKLRSDVVNSQNIIHLPNSISYFSASEDDIQRWIENEIEKMNNNSKKKNSNNNINRNIGSNYNIDCDGSFTFESNTFVNDDIVTRNDSRNNASNDARIVHVSKLHAQSCHSQSQSHGLTKMIHSNSFPRLPRCITHNNNNNNNNNNNHYSPQLSPRMSPRLSPRITPRNKTNEYVRTQLGVIKKLLNSPRILKYFTIDENNPITTTTHIGKTILNTLSRIKRLVISQNEEMDININNKLTDNNNNCLNEFYENENSETVSNISGMFCYYCNEDEDDCNCCHNLVEEIDNVYHDLEIRLNRLANGLIDKSVGPDGRDGKWHKSDLQYNLHLKRKVERSSIMQFIQNSWNGNKNNCHNNLGSICGDYQFLKNISKENSRQSNMNKLEYYQTGDKIGIWIDVNRKLIKFYKNRKLQYYCNNLPSLNKNNNEDYYLFVSLTQGTDCVVFDRIPLSSVELQDY